MSAERRIFKIDPAKKMEWAFTVFLFLSELALGIYLGEHKVLLGDAMSRTANAFYVYFSLPRRLTSMGLVWNPLPSFLQLPFVYLSQYSRWIVTKGFSMSFVTAMFAAASAKTLLGAFRKLNISKKISYLVTCLYVFNPYVFFYGANGMSEIIMAATGIQVICSFSLWMRRGGASHLIAMGFGFVVMFLVRYEAVPFAVFIAVGMALHMIFSRRERKYYAKKSLEPLWYIESTFWITFLPIIYTVLVWIFYNWAITGNPLYFMNSGYSMSAYSAYYTDYGGLIGAASFVWVRVWPFLLIGISLLIAKHISGKLFRYDTIAILFGVYGMTVFTFFMIAAGKSGGYVRYLMYPLVFAVAFIPYVLKESGKKLKTCTVVITITQLITILFFAWAMRYSSLFREDLLLNVPAHSEELAHYINTHLRDKCVLMDSYRTYYAIMNTDDPYDLIISCSPDFKSCLSDPIHNRVDYLVVPQIGSYGNMDALNIAWPDLYYGGEQWAEEVANIGEFKVFRVKR